MIPDSLTVAVKIHEVLNMKNDDPFSLKTIKYFNT